jgi:hypothetical protein
MCCVQAKQTHNTDYTDEQAKQTHNTDYTDEQTKQTHNTDYTEEQAKNTKHKKHTGKKNKKTCVILILTLIQPRRMELESIIFPTKIDIQ